MVIHNYKVRTGHVVSMAELEGGYVKGRLLPKDYDIKQWVGPSLTEELSNGITLEGPLQEGPLTLLPREGSRFHPC